VFNDLVRVDPVNIKPEHGESFLEQMERLRSFLDETSTLYPDASVLAVSHENPILAALAVAGDEPRLVVRRNIANCEWVELVWPVV
jgi:broad specificity phosphatase PhoE